MRDPTPNEASFPPVRTALVIIGITAAAVLVFRFTIRGGPAPSVDDIPAAMPIQVETQDEVVMEPGTIPGDALRQVTLMPSHSHPFLRAISYALIAELTSLPGVENARLLPDLPSGEPIPPGLQLHLELTDLNESTGIDPRSFVTTLRIDLHLSDHADPLPSLEVHQRADIHGAETPTIWFREAAAAMAPGIVSNLVQAASP